MLNETQNTMTDTITVNTVTNNKGTLTFEPIDAYDYELIFTPKESTDKGFIKYVTLEEVRTEVEAFLFNW